MSVPTAYPAAFPPITPLHYSIPNAYMYRRPMMQGKSEEQRPTTTVSSSVNSSGNSSPAPSLSSGSSEVSSPPPSSPPYNERPATDFYPIIPKHINQAITATATPTPAVPAYPANPYPSLDFPYAYDYYSNTGGAPNAKIAIPAMPPMAAMPIQSLCNDPSAMYGAYDAMMYDPSAFGAYPRNRIFDPRLYPPIRGYPIDEEWYAETKGKKKGGDKKRRFDEDDASRKRAKTSQQTNPNHKQRSIIHCGGDKKRRFDEDDASRKRAKTSQQTNPNHKQRSIIHCGIPRAYLEKKTTGETVEVNDEDRVYFLYSPFFGKELDVYYADDDPFHRPLFRASALHKKFGCATNKMDMYLCRKKAKEGPKCGIFQCLCFDGRREEHGLFGLKAGTYFVSEDACAAFADHAKEQRFRKKRTAKAKREKERLEKGHTDLFDDLSSDEDEEEETPKSTAASAANDRGVEMMVHMIQMFSKSNDNSSKPSEENKADTNNNTTTAPIVPPPAIASSNPSA